MIVYLLGMPGSGKSTLGRQLAAILNYSFLDLDEAIAKAAGQTISEIFAEKGETYFRQLESEVLRSLSSSSKNTVIATGGGTPCFHHNIEFMSAHGLTIYLKTSPEILTERLLAGDLSGRPLFNSKAPDDLYHLLVETSSKRVTFYQQAGIIFETRSLAADALTLAQVIRRFQAGS